MTMYILIDTYLSIYIIDIYLYLRILFASCTCSQLNLIIRTFWKTHFWPRPELTERLARMSGDKLMSMHGRHRKRCSKTGFTMLP